MIREFESSEVNLISERYEAFVEALAGYYTRRLNEGI
jgi:hypothetical protein